MTCSIFVYGTLQVGQCREHAWPYTAQSIRRGWTLGRLYDLGPFPAIVPGQDRILGELRTYLPEHMDDTLRVLDEIEGTNQPGEANEYDRLLVPVHIIDTAIGVENERPLTSPPAETRQAFAYFYADPAALRSSRYVAPNLPRAGQLYARWPDELSQPGPNLDATESG